MDGSGFILRRLVPVIPRRSIARTLGYTILGALLGGLYGVLHDQVTYSIGTEYFTRLKFDQFAYAKPDWGGPRGFVGIIGFLATWWVGALVAWVIARVSIWRRGQLPSPGDMARTFGIVLAVSLASAFAGWCWGQWRRATGYDEGWQGFMGQLGVTRPEEFMTVAYIHNASYLGGLLGMVVGLVWLGRRRSSRPAGTQGEAPTRA